MKLLIQIGRPLQHQINVDPETAAGNNPTGVKTENRPPTGSGISRSHILLLGDFTQRSLFGIGSDNEMGRSFSFPTFL